MRAIVLVGGAGTRLLPLTHHTPKALVPILNRPLLERLLRHLRLHGVTRVTLAMTQRNEAIPATIGDGSALIPTFRRLLQYTRDERPELFADKATRLKLSELEMELDVMRALTLTNASIVAHGDTPTMEASMAKVWTTELRYKLGSAGMDLLGREGALSETDDTAAPVGGEMDQAYRISPFLRFGGGTNEVMRDIIARRGLGLPR